MSVRFAEYTSASFLSGCILAGIGRWYGRALARFMYRFIKLHSGDTKLAAALFLLESIAALVAGILMQFLLPGDAKFISGGSFGIALWLFFVGVTALFPGG